MLTLAYGYLHKGVTMLALIGGLGVQELLLIFGVVLLLFGAKKIPEIAKSMGKGIREFKSSVKDDDSSKDKPSE